MAGVISLGRLIKLLELEPPDNTVCFDFGGFIPRGVDSWRGVYSELAIGYDDEWKKPVTVTELLAELKAAVGKKFEGYKGGVYIMSESTTVWADKYSESNCCAIVGLANCSYRTVLATEYSEP